MEAPQYLSDKPRTEGRGNSPLRYIPPGRREREEQSFHQRLDRHGKPYGPRVDTKQTRNPPPENQTDSIEASSTTTRRQRVEVHRETAATSPQYIQRREPLHQGPSRQIPPNNKLSIWREKALTASRTNMDIDANTQEETTPKPAPTLVEKEPITYQTTPTADEVLSEIHEATMQYINCGDPTESAARRQRVLTSEARGDVENAAAGIIAAAASNHNPITQTEPPILQNTKATIETGAPSRAHREHSCLWDLRKE
ncbi:hypothetical protein F2Q69_00041229 [Brassica cretica]|uniref:Uncharacterized protein n=1 Tax=Brassica cretica TaxID=69181 RepID=A0A8S9N5M0_BRACR|nr:hypothetical protein F2Q69_00041229 [Brassica cretica]